VTTFALKLVGFNQVIYPEGTKSESEL